MKMIIVKLSAMLNEEKNELEFTVLETMATTNYSEEEKWLTSRLRKQEYSDVIKGFISNWKPMIQYTLIAQFPVWQSVSMNGGSTYSLGINSSLLDIRAQSTEVTRLLERL